jgi:hypothetical protein
VKNNNVNIFSNKSIDQIYQNGSKVLTAVLPKGHGHITPTTKNVPNSIKLLDAYAQKLGYLPIG